MSQAAFILVPFSLLSQAACSTVPNYTNHNRKLKTFLNTAYRVCFDLSQNKLDRQSFMIPRTRYTAGQTAKEDGV